MGTLLQAPEKLQGTRGKQEKCNTWGWQLKVARRADGRRLVSPGRMAILGARELSVYDAGGK